MSDPREAVRGCKIWELIAARNKDIRSRRGPNYPDNLLIGSVSYGEPVAIGLSESVAPMLVFGDLVGTFMAHIATLVAYNNIFETSEGEMFSGIVIITTGEMDWERFVQDRRGMEGFTKLVKVGSFADFLRRRVENNPGKSSIAKRVVPGEKVKIPQQRVQVLLIDNYPAFVRECGSESVVRKFWEWVRGEHSGPRPIMVIADMAGETGVEESLVSSMGMGVTVVKRVADRAYRMETERELESPREQIVTLW